jgi:hypothetical protein
MSAGQWEPKNSSRRKGLRISLVTGRFQMHLNLQTQSDAHLRLQIVFEYTFLDRFCRFQAKMKSRVVPSGTSRHLVETI